MSAALPAATALGRRSGRPRSRPAATDLSPRQQILDAAAALFADAGFAATTTRAIAERVGIRQASLYYHFAGKEEILLELLSRSVRPSLDFARTLESAPGSAAPPAARLWALATVDVGLLGDTPHNVATLYLAPELQHERFDRFRSERAELRDAYGRLAAAAACGPAAALGATLLGALIMQLVESVIHLRRDGAFLAWQAHPIATSCLRLVGLAEPALDRARAEAAALVTPPVRG